MAIQLTLRTFDLIKVMNICSPQVAAIEAFFNGRSSLALLVNEQGVLFPVVLDGSTYVHNYEITSAKDSECVRCSVQCGISHAVRNIRSNI